MKEQFDDNYINIEDAAQYLGIKPVTLRNWIKKENGILTRIPEQTTKTDFVKNLSM